MANYKVTDSELISIADAIRTKGGTSASLAFPSGFVSAIGDIQTGGMSLSAADEGKVVVSGALSVQGVMSVSQNSVYDTTLFSQVSVAIPEATLVSKTISENGTYNPADDSADAYSQVIVSVASGGGGDNNSGLDVLLGYSSGSIFHSSVTSIPAELCKNNTYVIGASFPECLTVKASAFSGCFNLMNVSFPKCTSIESSAFYNCSSLSTVFLPKCASVGTQAFGYCINLSVASFPECASISANAFSRCYNLLSLYLLSASVTKLALSNAFSSTPIAGYTASTGGVYGSIFVPASLVDSYKAANNWSVYADRITSYTE